MTDVQGATSHPLSKLVHFREDNEAALADRARLSLRDYCQVSLALVILAVLINLFHIEEDLALPKLMWIATGGYLLYAFLPLGFRLPCFVALNTAALVLLFGALNGLIAFGLGLLFIFCASLEIGHVYRVALVLLLGAGAAVVKSGVVGDAGDYQVATILGGLFMFRLMLYLYEIRHEKTPVTVWKRVSYFFLLPNLVFLIFPIVDYKTFVRNFYSRPAAETSRRGVYWIFTGFLHLLIYRLIYSYAIPMVDDIHGLYSLVQYMVSSYALIIRLSGIFHLSAGIICLFGFDLPRTFNHYFLASSFSDLWNRINIYWRGFVMKVFYYPIFMRFKERNGRAVFITVILVFTVNFLLHSYQWFWIRGKFLVTETDVAFWGILGLMLAINSVLALKRKRPLAVPGYSWRDACVMSLKILGMFSFMCVMWSLWISGSLDTWWRLLRRASGAEPREYLVVLSVMAALVVLGTVLQLFRARQSGGSQLEPAAAPASVGLVAGLAACLCVVASPLVTERIESSWSLDLSPVLSEQLNEQDTELLRKGYYEELIIGNTISSRMWEVREDQKLSGSAPPKVDLDLDVADDFEESGNTAEALQEKKDIERRMERKRERAAMRGQSRREAGLYTDPIRFSTDTRDLLMSRLLPNKTLIRDGARFTTNAFGLRDRPYTLEKPPGTYRIAQLGGSPQMGPGVADDETAENLVEDRLNAEGGWGRYDKVEILNFAMSSYGLINQVGVAILRLDKFDPDMVLLYLHSIDEERRNREKFAKAMRLGLVDDFPRLDQLSRKLDIGPDTPQEEAEYRLAPYDDELFQWGLDWMIRYCRDRDIPLVVVIHGVLNGSDSSAKVNADRYGKMLAERGVPYIDLSTYWDDYDENDLTIARWDRHPNVKAHQLIAGKLYTGLRRLQKDLVGDGPESTGN